MKKLIIISVLVIIGVIGGIILSQPLPNVNKQAVVHLTDQTDPVPVVPTPTPVVTPTPVPVAPMPLVTFSGDANTQTNVPDITIDGSSFSQEQIDSATFVPTQAWTLTINWTCTSVSNNGKVYPNFAVFDVTTNGDVPQSGQLTWDNPTQALSGTVTLPETSVGDTLQIETYVQPCTWTVVVQ